MENTMVKIDEKKKAVATVNSKLLTFDLQVPDFKDRIRQLEMEAEIGVMLNNDGEECDPDKLLRMMRQDEERAIREANEEGPFQRQ